ncbi:DUF3892 domain-containing protein [Archangium violaceum]|uniref:DUF3892 domain-containing protein n=1 Tax=Archangium violaceum TaxID=83451 RepID=UPI002B2FB365|nr:DUF3892 domain-containing protein [Archangium violaceum]
MLYITAIRLSSGGCQHEHITDVRWQESGSLTTGQNSRAEMVAWIDKGGEARVKDGASSVLVEVVRTNPPHLRTKANGRYTDNLLSLPRF